MADHTLKNILGSRKVQCFSDISVRMNPRVAAYSMRSSQSSLATSFPPGNLVQSQNKPHKGLSDCHHPHASDAGVHLRKLTGNNRMSKDSQSDTGVLESLLKW